MHLLQFRRSPALFWLLAALVPPVAAPVWAQATWTTLLDGSSLVGWNTIGNANWKASGGVVEATSGSGYLLSRGSYKDFNLRAEVWVDEPANSGIFLRCSKPEDVSQSTAYEVNIFDERPDPKYATGSIVDLASSSQVMKAAGRWNTVEITAIGSRITVRFNGVQTVDLNDTKHAGGPIALQHSAGTVRFRKVEIQPL